jgi:Flp pilus assembly pilin Flp
MSKARKFYQDESAVTAAEYCLMVALIAMAVFASVGLVGLAVRVLFNMYVLPGV